MNKLLELDDEEIDLLLKYVACRTFLDQYDQHLEITMMGMQRRVFGHGMRNKRELHEDMVKYQSEIADNPRLQEALSSREWYLAKENGLYTLAYKLNTSEKLERSVLNYFDIIESTFEVPLKLFEYKEFRWGAGGFLSGALLVFGYFQPLWFIKILVFVFVSGIIFFLGLLGTFYILEQFENSSDSKETFTTGKKVLIACLMVFVFSVAIFIGIVMAGEVRQSSYQYDDREQIYW